MSNVIYPIFPNNRKINVEIYRIDIYLLNGEIDYHSAEAVSNEEAYDLAIDLAAEDGILLDMIESIAMYTDGKVTITYTIDHH